MRHGLQVGECLVCRDDPPGIRGDERLLVRLGPGTSEGATVAVEYRRLDPSAPLPLDAVDGAGSEIAQANAEGVLPGMRFAELATAPVAHRPALLTALVEGDVAPGVGVPVDPEGRAALDDLELAGLGRGGGCGDADFDGHGLLLLDERTGCATRCPSFWMGSCHQLDDRVAKMHFIPDFELSWPFLLS